jgi:outer membrane protein TolC
MKRSAALLIFFIFLFSPLARAEVVSLALDESVAIALRENRDVLLKAADVKKAKLKVAEAKGIYYPSVTFTAGVNKSIELLSKDVTTLTTQTSVKQYLYRGGKTVNTIRFNENGLVIAEALSDKTKLVTIANVKDAFYALLLARDFSRLNKSILDNAEEHYNYFNARYKNGEVSGLDVLSVKASLKNLKTAYEASLRQIESLQVLFRNLLYLDSQVRVQPKGALLYSREDKEFDAALMQALCQRPEIREYEAQERANKNAIEIAKADNRPSIYASWDYYSRSGSAVSTSKGWQDNSVVGITFSWPIFDGWQTKAKVEQAIVDLKETKLTQEKVARDIVSELKNAYISLKNSLSQIEATDADIAVYKDNARTAQEKHARGEVSVLDLSDATLKYQVSSFNRIQAIYDYWIARIQFDKARGEF